MKRYKAETIFDTEIAMSDCMMVEDPQGEWVKFEDAEKAIDEAFSEGYWSIVPLKPSVATASPSFTDQFIDDVICRLRALESKLEDVEKPSMRVRSAGLDDFKKVVDRLSELLCDPHPGLSTWHMVLSQKVKELNEIWNV